MPAADLFLINGTPWRAASEALAARVSAINPLGLAFVDPSRAPRPAIW